jgi:hypothetical protein
MFRSNWTVRARGVTMLSLLFCAACFASPIKDYLNEAVGAGSVAGYIEADGTSGILAPNIILGWNLLLNDGTNLHALPEASIRDPHGSNPSTTANFIFDFSIPNGGGTSFSTAGIDYHACFATYSCVSGGAGLEESMNNANARSAQLARLSSLQLVPGPAATTNQADPIAAAARTNSQLSASQDYQVASWADEHLSRLPR